jgi:hypothetical protein
MLNVVPFPVYRPRKVKIKVKGNGQACPFHTSMEVKVPAPSAALRAGSSLLSRGALRA